MNLILIATVFGTALTAAMAQTPTVYVPHETTVAILPVLDVSGQYDRKISDSQCKIVQDEFISEFKDRGFRLVDPGTVGSAIKSSNIDLADVEQRKRAVMIGIGKGVSADLVAFIAVTDRAKGETNGGLGEKEATIRIWLLDVSHESAILSAKAEECKSGGTNIFDRGSWTSAYSHAVKDGLEPFMKQYKLSPAGKQ